MPKQKNGQTLRGSNCKVSAQKNTRSELRVFFESLDPGLRQFFTYLKVQKFPGIASMVTVITPPSSVKTS